MKQSHKQTATLLGLMLLIVLLWDTWAVYPIKILVVFFHELSHALMAVVTGGELVEIQLHAAQGGHCITRGGIRFLTLNAGYLGSLAFGGAILIAAARTRLDKYITGLLGAMIFSVGLLFIRPFLGFGFLFALTAGIALVAAARYGTKPVNNLLLKTMGLTSCCYAILDIKSDILDRPTYHSDAYRLAELTGIPAVLWGGLWIILAIIAAGIFLKIAARGDVF